MFRNIHIQYINAKSLIALKRTHFRDNVNKDHAGVLQVISPCTIIKELTIILNLSRQTVKGFP